MAIVHSTAKARSGRRQNQRKDQPPPPNGRRPSRVHGGLRAFFESERGFLIQAHSLLECVAHSMEHAEHPVEGPYYPDVLGLASKLIRQRTRNLDELLLDGRLPPTPRP
jgi:hypothetical protein